MHFIEKTTIGGNDWHDTKQYSDYLSDNGSYEIKKERINRLIAEDVVKELKAVKATNTFKRGGKTKTVTHKLLKIPSIDEVMDAIVLGKTLNFASDIDTEAYHELEAVFEGKSMKIITESGGGQVIYHTDYLVKDIALENVRYLTTENFLCPQKGIPSASRFFMDEFLKVEDALAALEKMRLRGENSRKELVIADVHDFGNNEWYKINKEVIRILGEHPELDNKDNFFVLVNLHLGALERALEKSFP